MKKIFCLVLVLAIAAGLCLYAAAAFAGEAGPSPTNSQTASEARYRPGELLVKFKPGCEDKALKSFKKSARSVSSAELVSPLQVDKVKFAGESVEQAAAELKATGLVDYAVPNYIRYVSYTPNDPDFLSPGNPANPDYPANQWNLQNNYTGGGVDMPEAWDVVKGGDPSVVVAIVDSGVAYETAHGFNQAPDLAGTTFVPGYDFVNNDPSPDDDHGHGTHVCGTIAQTTDNSIGVAGIAFKCSIMPIKVMDRSGAGDDATIATGVAFAADHGVQVINMSIGGPDPSPTLETVVNYATAKGAVVCAASGNEGASHVSYPAAYAACISVGATNRSANKTSYSNYGDALDVVAPGGDSSNYIYQQTYKVEKQPNSPFLIMGYAGTSMACPHVTGEAALIRSLHPDWSVNEVASVIKSTCHPLGAPGWNSQTGYGLIDVNAALHAQRPILSPVWYFAEGSCRPNFDPYLCVQNPGGTDAQVLITYMPGQGGPIQQPLVVPANTRVTVRVKDKLGEGNDPSHDFSSKIECTNGQMIIAERAMYFDFKGDGTVNWTGGHDVMGAQTPSSTFFFAEGTCRPGFDPYICIQNPTGTGENVNVVYMTGAGKTLVDNLTVGANARTTVRVKDSLGEGNDNAHDFSSMVVAEETGKIIAERAMYFDYKSASGASWTGGHDVVGSLFPASTFYFAEGTCRPGFDPYICIQNPQDFDVNVLITYMLGNGQTTNQSIKVTKSSRSTVSVKNTLGEGNDEAHDFSCKVDCPGGGWVIAERPMYFNYQGGQNLNWTGGHDVIGAIAPQATFFFAEGSCRPGFDPYICMQNPGTDDVGVVITYMLGNGQTVTQELTVGRNSRFTVRVKSKLGEANDPAHDFSAKVATVGGRKIIAERPMYFDYTGAGNVNWTGGHDVVGFTP